MPSTNILNNAPIVGGTSNQVSSTYSGNTATISLPSNVLNSQQALFGAYLSSQHSNVTGNGAVYTILYDTILVNQGGRYNASTGIFTAPAAGNYLFCTYNLIIGAAGPTAAEIILDVNGTGYLIDYSHTFAAGPTNSTLKGWSIVSLPSSGQVSMLLYMQGSTMSASIKGTGAPYSCYFSGMLLPA